MLLLGAALFLAVGIALFGVFAAALAATFFLGATALTTTAEGGAAGHAESCYCENGCGEDGLHGEYSVSGVGESRKKWSPANTYSRRW